MEEEMETPKKKEPITFEFPIKETEGILQMKNIPPSALPNFRGLPSEDPDTFLFEFDVLCRSYDYYFYAHKLKLFSHHLSGSVALATKIYLNKIEDCCYKTRNSKEN
jgi:hypothetical protein